MTISSSIVEQILEELENKGIVFEDHSEIGKYLTTSIQRAELWKILKNHVEKFDKTVECQSLSILSQRTFYYYFFVWENIESKYPDMFYKDAIRHIASIHYRVNPDDITFDFI